MILILLFSVLIKGDAFSQIAVDRFDFNVMTHILPLTLQLSQNLVALAVQWMTYVLDSYDRGRGTRPRWAAQGLDFLTFALEPRVRSRQMPSPSSPYLVNDISN